MTQGGYQVIIILPIKSKKAAAKKHAVLFAISVGLLNRVFTIAIQSPWFTNGYKFGMSVNTYQ